MALSNIVKLNFMIIPTIHERCTMEESEPAFNQLVTLEQNQLKKKITKKHLFNLFTSQTKQQNDQRSRWRSISISISERRPDLAPSFDQRETTRGRTSLSKGSRITEITLRHRRIRCCIFATPRDNAQFYLFSDPPYRLVVRFDDDGAREERSAFPSCTAASTQVSRSEW